MRESKSNRKENATPSGSMKFLQKEWKADQRCKQTVSPFERPSRQNAEYLRLQTSSQHASAVLRRSDLTSSE